MKNTNTKTLTRVALLVAIELVMKLVGLGSVPMGPLYMSFLTLPIAVGAITMGPAVGALLGGVFGVVRGYAVICLIAAVIPMVYTALDSSVVQTLFADSSMGKFFLNGDSLLSDLFRISSQIDKVMRAMPKVIV